MNISPLRVAYGVLLIGLTAACAPQSSTPQPPEIIYGQDVCDGCGMIISDARFAAALVLTNGEGRKFDDIGEMLTYQMEHPEAQVKAWFVHDYSSTAWIRGETAVYVKGAGLQTPMGGNIVAFENRALAEDYVTETKGHIYTLDELRAETHLIVHGE